MPARTIGWFGEDIWDAAEDVVSTVVDNLSDAGRLIGAALQFVSPIVAMWPGIGTAVSVAFSAAAAVAQGTPIDDAIIITASNAIPGGLPRIGFNTAVNVTRDVAHGNNAFGSVVEGLRGAAQQAGGDRARFAFDTGLGIARGERVSDQAIKAARDQAAQGGTQSLAAFDAGVAVAKGEGADGALLAVARDYIAATNNPLALAAFDAGLALAHGQALQEAGFAALQALVQGNDSGERAVRFLRKMEQAAREGRSVLDQLVGDLQTEMAPFIGQLDAGEVLAPYLDAMRADSSALTWGSQALADAWGEAEPLVRAAQAILRAADVDLESLLTRQFAKSIGRVEMDEETAAREAARWAAVVAANPGVPEICLRATDARARNSPVAATLEQQCADYRRANPVSSGVRTTLSPTIYAQAAYRPPQPIVQPTSRLVPFAPASLERSAREAAAPAASSAGSVVVIGTAAGALGLALWFALRD